MRAIANANHVRVTDRYSRKQWMLQLCDALMEFYPREIDNCLGIETGRMGAIAIRG